MDSYSEILLLVAVGALLVVVVLLVISVKRKSLAQLLLDDVMDASEYGVVIFDFGGVFKKANQCAHSALSNIIDGGLKGMDQFAFLDFLYDYAEDIDESIRNTILKENDGDIVGDFREVVSFCDGALFLVEASNINGGMTLFTLTNISTIQAREKDIIQLNNFNNQLMQAIQATTSGIVISDPKLDTNQIIFANDAFCEYVSCNRTHLIGSNWSVVLGMVSAQADKGKLIRALNYGSEVDLALEKVFDEDIRYFTMKLTPVKDSDGALDLFIGVLSEITLLKQRESEFFHVQKLESLGQLAAGVAHDFNNILSIIGGYSLMSANVLEGDEYDEVRGYLKRVDEAAARGASLTRKMLTFSRHKVVSQSVINICDVINEQRELLRPLLGVSINLKVNMPDNEINIKGGADSVGQILMNFVVNARDAMPDGGDISIDVTCLAPNDIPTHINKAIGADEYVRVCVSDTGTGMDEKTMERMFDPFFSTKDQGKGTGLGLSVVYGLVKEMGGVLDVSSTLGTGSVLSFYIAVSEEGQSKKIIGDVSDLSTICLDGYTALVAEDEPDLLILVTNMLEKLGLKVLGACNGDEALVFLDDNMEDIDILLTDVVMPELDGVKLAELVSALHPKIKTIFMSGYPAKGDMAPVELPDGITFIAKPVDYNNLAAMILQKLREGTSEAAAMAVDAVPHWETSGASGEV